MLSKGAQCNPSVMALGGGGILVVSQLRLLDAASDSPEATTATQGCEPLGISDPSSSCRVGDFLRIAATQGREPLDLSSAF